MSRRASAPKQAPVPADDLRGDLRRLVGAAHLEAIDLVHLEVERLYDDVPYGGQLSATTEYEIEASVEIRTPNATVASSTAIHIEMKLLWKDKENKNYARGRIGYRAAYSFRDLEAPPSPELLKLFGDDLALHHVWPFLRERLRTVSVELGMPPLILPLRKASQ